jgi:hypothetical protein
LPQSKNHALLSNASLSGFVIDMQTGEPLANVMIQCMDILHENATIQQGGDLNSDGLVDMFDLSMFMQRWFDSGRADLDANGIVNLSDFKVIGQMWMSQAAWRIN